MNRITSYNVCYTKLLRFLRVAAVLTIAVISSVLVWKTGVIAPERLAKNADPELLELMETEARNNFV